MKIAAHVLGIAGGILAIICALAACLLGGIHLLMLFLGDALPVPSASLPPKQLETGSYSVLIPCVLGFAGGVAASLAVRLPQDVSPAQCCNSSVVSSACSP